jgi:NAD(P)-dependent dehydrogenase (short-subunit alcohol dehydrogenase family)
MGVARLEAANSAGGGSIVVTSSIGGLVGGARNSDCAASRWALAGLVKSAALDYAPYNIRVSAIAPGATHSEMRSMDEHARAPRLDGRASTAQLHRAP